jgi:hypothetical protein
LPKTGKDAGRHQHRLGTVTCALVRPGHGTLTVLRSTDAAIKKAAGMLRELFSEERIEQTMLTPPQSLGLPAPIIGGDGGDEDDE